MVRMHCYRLLMAATALCTLGAALGAARAADVDKSRDTNTPCFFLRSWDGQWKVTPDSRTIYVVQNGTTFRLDLQQPIKMLQSPWAVLSTRNSSEAVCRPEDMHLVVSDRLGGLDTPIVTKITALTPQEVAALPQKLRPR